jgi:hypothetical protein
VETPTKLTINLSEATVEVEGTEEFVRLVYQDFRDSLSKHIAAPHIQARTLEQIPPPALLTQKTSGSKKGIPSTGTNRGDGEAIRRTSYKPKFNSGPDLAGLDKAYDEFNPQTHPEKILLCAVFLRDHVGMDICTANDIFTCYFTLQTRTKAPTAFVQAFYDTQRKTHFIDFVSLDEIPVTIAGNNYFNEKKEKQKGAVK